MYGSIKSIRPRKLKEIGSRIKKGSDLEMALDIYQGYSRL